MINVHIDIESFGYKELKDVGVHKYAPEAEILLLGLGMDTGKIYQFAPFLHGSFTGTPWCEFIKQPDVLLWAHNAEFEFAMLNGAPGEAIGFPKTDISKWRCTEALAHSLALPGKLDTLCKVLRLPPELQKIKGTHLITRFCKPRKPTANMPYDRILPMYDPVRFRDFMEYHRQDVEAERTIARLLSKYHLDDFNQRVWEETVKMNIRGVPFDIKLVKHSRQIVDKLLKQADEDCRKTTGYKVTQREKLKSWCNERLEEGMGLENMQAEYLYNYIKNWGGFNQEVTEVLQLYRENNSASVKKLKKIQTMVMPDETVKGCYRWHKTTTGRWASWYLQTHNFTRPKPWVDVELAIEAINKGDIDFLKSYFGNPIEAIGSCLRGMIRAPEGYDMFVSDYSGIEFRIVCWLVGYDDVLQQLVDGGDPYTDMAATIYKIDPKSVNDQQYHLGKQTILGGQYQMSAERFQSACADYNLIINMETAGKAISDFRKKYAKIKTMWNDLDMSLKEVITGAYDMVELCGGKIKIFKEDRFLFIQLPSGRKLAYPYPRTGYFNHPKLGKIYSSFFIGQIGQSALWGDNTTHGGKALENIAQGIGADIMMQGFLNVIDENYLPFGLTHDEGMSIIEKGRGSLNTYNEALCRMPSWADGLPIKAKGFITNRYRKG